MLRLICSLVAVGVLLTAHPMAQSGPGRNRVAASAPAAKPAVLVNLNTASVTELATLPGIGEKTAARIVEYREKKGPFKKIEELMNVQGVGEKSFLKLRSQLTVAGKPASAAVSKQN